MNEPKTFEAGNNGMKSVFADPLALATKPPVIFKFASAVLSLVVYSCVSAAWYDGRCLFNRYNGICRFGSLALISFIACVVLLLLEIFFNHISSIKVRRRIAIGDVIVSSWLKSDYPPFGHSINCCRVAILLSFLAIFALAACTGLAYVRYQSGVDMTQFMTEEQLAQEQAQYYDEQGNYQGAQYTMDNNNNNNQGGGTNNGNYGLGNESSQQYGQQTAIGGGGSYINYGGDVGMN